MTKPDLNARAAATAGRAFAPAIETPAGHVARCAAPGATRFGPFALRAA